MNDTVAQSETETAFNPPAPSPPLSIAKAVENYRRASAAHKAACDVWRETQTEADRLHEYVILTNHDMYEAQAEMMRAIHEAPDATASGA